MRRLAAFALGLTACSGGAAAADADAAKVAAAAEKCRIVAEQPSTKPYATKPVEIFDDCIVEEANKAPLETRKAICALGRSGGSEGSPVEVYMYGDTCRADYE